MAPVVCGNCTMQTLNVIREKEAGCELFIIGGTKGASSGFSPATTKMKWMI